MGSAVDRWLEHVRALAQDTGARGPATGGEDKALDYCLQAFRSAGLEPREDRFASAGSVFRPHLAAALGMLGAFALYPFFPWPAAALAVAVTASEVLELTLRPNPLQWVLPKRPSRNIYAVIEPEGPVKQDAVIMGHADTQRTPVIFSSAGWLTAYRIFSALAFAVFLLTAVGYVLGALLGWPWIWPASLATALSAAVLLAICVEADLSPFTAGANDNATGAGLVLTLAGETAARPLANTRLWLVCSGCEEALHEGARTFFRTHRREMTNPRAIVFEMLGCSGPAWVASEGIVLRIFSDPGLRALAAGVARRHPELGAYPVSVVGGVTEMADALAAGVPAITVIGLTPDGVGPHWHRATDTFDKMNPEIMERNHRFVLALLNALDAV